MITPRFFQRSLNACEDFCSRVFTPRFFLWGSFVFVYGYLLLMLVLPMLLQNAMVMWDHPGLYFSTWYEKEYVFPEVFAWNPYFYAGYAHNQFYPPLYPYLAAALSHIFSVTVSLRIMLALTLILTPLSFYVFGKSLRFSKEKAAVSMFVMFSLLFLFPTSYYGGNLSSTFKIGLVTHAFGMMLFFFYFASLMRAKDTGRVLLPTFLFVLIILSHIVVAVVAGIALVAFILLYARRKKFRKFLMWHVGLTFLLTAFWTLPFIAKQPFMNVIHLNNSVNIKILCLYAVVYTLFLVLREQTSETRAMYPVAFFLLLILAAALSGDVLSSFRFHFYRLFYFIILMIPIVLLSLTKKSAFAMALLVLLGLSLIAGAVPVSPIGPKSMETQPVQYALEGRTFIVASYDEETAPHLLQHLLPIENKIFGVKGLYVESTRNGEYLLSFEKELDPDRSLSWGNFIYSEYPPRNATLLDEILPYQLRLFQINNIIISQNHSRPEWQYLQEITRYTVPGKEVVYNLYHVDNAHLAEVVTAPLRVVDEDAWKGEALKWFFSPAIKNELLVNAPVPSSGGEYDSVEVIEQSLRQDYVRLKVNAEQEVPILVKISYFPNWKAYEGEREIPIYRAAPDLMLVYGKGEIELRYEALPVDTTGRWLSLIGLVLFAVALGIRLPEKLMIKKKNIA